MKHICHVIVFAILLSCQFFHQAKAQENIIKINPTSLFILTGNIQYERVVNDMSSVQLGVFFTGFSFGTGDERVSYSGFGLTPEYRFYLTNKVREVPRGFYVGPFIRYINFRLGVVDGGVDGRIQLNSIGGGGILGFQFVNEGGFVVDLFIGPNIRSTNLTGDTDQQDDIRFLSSSSVGVRSGVSIGFAF